METQVSCLELAGTLLCWGPAHVKCLAPLNVLHLSYLKMKLFHSHTVNLKHLREFIEKQRK